jgi:membrane-associated PAP2 superfamily phosphatase
VELITIECITKQLVFCEAIVAFIGVMVFWRSGGKASRETPYWEAALLCVVGVVVIPVLGYFIIARCQKYFCPWDYIQQVLAFPGSCFI